MRERLVVAFVSLSVAVLAVFLVERAYATSDLIRDQARREVEHAAAVAAGLLEQRRTEPDPGVLRLLLDPGDRLVHVAADGRRTGLGPSGRGDPEDLVVVRDLGDRGMLRVTRPAESVDARVADALLPLALVALGLLAAAAAAGVRLARRLARPFAELAEVAGRVGRGDFDVEVPRSTLPEADAVGRVLRASAQDLSALGRREREFAVHASHELRTPITAARLELEDLVAGQASPDVVTRIDAAIDQLDRLGASLAGLLDAARESRVASRVDIDLTALVRDVASRWRQLAPARGIEVVGDTVVAVRLPAGALVQVMDVLVGNAVTHGRGVVRVQVTETPAYAEVRVADEGPRPQDRLLAAGTGGTVGNRPGGLRMATEIAASLGGRLRLAEDATTTFSLALPRSVRETVVR